MRELNKWQTLIFQAGGLFVLLGAIIWTANWKLGLGLYFTGALAFGAMQMLCRYEGSNVTLRRLRRMQVFGAVILLLTGVLMFISQQHIGILYHNEWMVGLAVAAVLECYTAFRIPVELKKEEKE